MKLDRWSREQIREFKKTRGYYKEHDAWFGMKIKWDEEIDYLSEDEFFLLIHLIKDKFPFLKRELDEWEFTDGNCHHFDTMEPQYDSDDHNIYLFSFDLGGAFTSLEIHEEHIKRYLLQYYENAKVRDIIHVYRNGGLNITEIESPESNSITIEEEID